MKTKTLLALVLLCASAVAQIPNITFSDLHGKKIPQKVPDNYHSLSWSGVFFVVGYGVGIEEGTNATVGITGLCGTQCAATISGTTPFNLFSGQIAAGWGDNTLSVMPMRNGRAIGVFVFQLTTTPVNIDFTQYWTGAIDSVVFTPTAGAVVYNDFTTDTK
jgi:hypothetical protein